MNMNYAWNSDTTTATITNTNNSCVANANELITR